jgi:hypothetical protein
MDWLDHSVHSILLDLAPSRCSLLRSRPFHHCWLFDLDKMSRDITTVVRSRHAIPSQNHRDSIRAMEKGNEFDCRSRAMNQWGPFPNAIHPEMIASRILMAVCVLIPCPEAWLILRGNRFVILEKGGLIYVYFDYDKLRKSRYNFEVQSERTSRPVKNSVLAPCGTTTAKLKNRHHAVYVYSSNSSDIDGSSSERTLIGVYILKHF